MKTEYHDFYKAIGARIKKARKERGMNQSTLANMLSITRTTLVNMEHGRQQLAAHQIVLFCKALNIPFETLLRSE